jgi:hypothetical protein
MKVLRLYDRASHRARCCANGGANNRVCANDRTADGTNASPDARAGKSTIRRAGAASGKATQREKGESVNERFHEKNPLGTVKSINIRRFLYETLKESPNGQKCCIINTFFLC